LYKNKKDTLLNKNNKLKISLVLVTKVYWPSVLWHCWLGVRKSICHTKNWVMRWWVWLSVWSEVQIICIWSSWCHYHPNPSLLLH